MGQIVRRFASHFTFIALIAVLGTGQRLWEKRQPKKSAVAEAAEKIAEQMKKSREQMAEARRQLQQMSPGDQGLLQDAISAGQSDILANPLFQKLSKPGSSKNTLSKEKPSAVRTGSKLYDSWKAYEGLVSRALWGLCAAIVALGGLGMALGKESLASMAVSVGMNVGELWLIVVAVVNALAFSLIGLNPWGDTAVAYYAAPALLFVISIFLSLGQSRITEILLDSFAAMTAPAASLLVIALLGCVQDLAVFKAG